MGVFRQPDSIQMDEGGELRPEIWTGSKLKGRGRAPGFSNVVMAMRVEFIVVSWLTIAFEVSRFSQWFHSVWTLSFRLVVNPRDKLFLAPTQWILLVGATEMRSYYLR